MSWSVNRYFFLIDKSCKHFRLFKTYSCVKTALRFPKAAFYNTEVNACGCFPIQTYGKIELQFVDSDLKHFLMSHDPACNVHLWPTPRYMHTLLSTAFEFSSNCIHIHKQNMYVLGNLSSLGRPKLTSWSLFTTAWPLLWFALFEPNFWVPWQVEMQVFLEVMALNREHFSHSALWNVSSNFFWDFILFYRELFSWPKNCRYILQLS